MDHNQNICEFTALLKKQKPDYALCVWCVYKINFIFRFGHHNIYVQLFTSEK